MDNYRLRRLKSDEEAMRRLVRLHPRIEVEGVSGNPPDRYILLLKVPGIRKRGDEIQGAGVHKLEIRLALGYPRDAPVCRMLTPVFHPNIAPHAICVCDHWTAAESLDLVVQRVGEMICFQSYNIKSPLNGLAAKWADENGHRFPLLKKEFFIDLNTASAPSPAMDGGHQCGNCGDVSEELTACPDGHRLCPQCAPICEECGRLICLQCGMTRCPECNPVPTIDENTHPEGEI